MLHTASERILLLIFTAGCPLLVKETFEIMAPEQLFPRNERR